LFAAGTPFWFCAPIAVVPIPALPGTDPNDVADPLQGVPPPARPELGRSGEETPGEMIVLCPTGGPFGTVGVVGVVNVPCAQACEAMSIKIAVKVSVLVFIFLLRDCLVNSPIAPRVPARYFDASRF
jgi:hypothetical protein